MELSYDLAVSTFRTVTAPTHRPFSVLHLHPSNLHITRSFVLKIQAYALPPPLSSSSPTVAVEENQEDKVKPIPVRTLEQPGGKMVVELVGAFNELAERINELSTSSSRILFKALKLSIPILQTLPLCHDGRSPLSKALSVAVLLAGLQMDAEAISAGILREAWEAGAISMHAVRNRVGAGTAHLLHESLRVKKMPFQIDASDDEDAAAIRKYCLTYYDIRAVVLDLVLKLDVMRHLDYLPRYEQQMISLEVMKLHAPLAHAIGITFLSLELEDLSFQYLFPHSYLYLGTWLRSHETGSKPLVEQYKDELLEALQMDLVLTGMVDDICVNGRFKICYSTMKKLLKDGRKPDEVNDII